MVLGVVAAALLMTGELTGMSAAEVAEKTAPQAGALPAPPPSPAPAPAPAPPVIDSLRIRGFILGNSTWNIGTTTDGDLPVLAAPGSGDLSGEATFNGTVRQTRVGLDSTFYQRGWRLSGIVDVDFYGVTGSDPHGGILESGLRLVHAYAEAQYGLFTIDVGQLETVFAPLDPDSLAYVSVSPLTYAGNLWNRIPQVRGTFRHHSGIEAELAFLRPFSGIDQPTLGSQRDTPGFGEQAVWAMTEGRVAFVRQSERRGLGVGLSGHLGVTDLTAIDPRTMARVAETQSSQAIALDLQGRYFRGTFKAEGFYGFNIAMLHGLGFSDVRAAEGGFTDGRTGGAWAQLGFIVLESEQQLNLHGGFGIENPMDDDLNVPRPVRNLSAYVNAIYRPLRRLAAALQWTFLYTDYKTTAASLSASSGQLHAINLAIQLFL